MEWKKQDDIKYKPRGFLDAIMRGSHQATPKEIHSALPGWVSADHFPSFDKNIESYSDLLKFFISN
jgi:hypothetical protein